MCIVGINKVMFVGNLKVFTFGWVELHLPCFTPFCKVNKSACKIIQSTVELIMEYKRASSADDLRKA